MRLILVHGFTQTGRSWAPVVPLLEEAGHEVETPDLPGHGRAAGRKGDLDEMAGGLAEAAPGGTRRASVWVGYSLGGRACLHVATAHPEVVKGLVLISTTAGIDDTAERADRRAADEALAAEIEAGDVPAFVDRWLSGPLWQTLIPTAAGAGIRRGNTAAGLASSLRLAGTGAQEPLWDRLGPTAIPTLVVTGGRDAKFTAIGRRLVAALGPQASGCIVPGAGHAVPWERPVTTALTILDWLDRHLTQDHADGEQ